MNWHIGLKQFNSNHMPVKNKKQIILMYLTGHFNMTSWSCWQNKFYNYREAITTFIMFDFHISREKYECEAYELLMLCQLQLADYFNCKITWIL